MAIDFMKKCSSCVVYKTLHSCLLLCDLALYLLVFDQMYVRMLIASMYIICQCYKCIQTDALYDRYSLFGCHE
jgi:hypothetical protein